MTEVTGPKISSCAIRASGLTSAKIVGSKNEPFASAPSRAAADDEIALVAPDRRVGRDALDGRLVDHGTDVGRLVEAVAEDELRHSLLKPMDEVVVDGPMDDQA